MCSHLVKIRVNLVHASASQNHFGVGYTDHLKLKLCYILQYFPTYSFGKFETNLKNVVDDRKDGEGGQNYHPKPEKYVDLLIDDIDW